MENRYYTLATALSLKDIVVPYHRNAKPYNSSSLLNLNDYYPFWDETTLEGYYENGYLGELWLFIYARYENEFATIFVDDNEKDESIKSFLKRIVNTYLLSKDRYEEMLKIYDANKDKLLDRVKTVASNESKFNDTPQDSGDFVDDEHVTNITKDVSESSSDFDTLMARIDEINSKFRNIYAEWCSEFEKCFIENLNYDIIK